MKAVAYGLSPIVRWVVNPLLPVGLAILLQFYRTALFQAATDHNTPLLVLESMWGGATVRRLTRSVGRDYDSAPQLLSSLSKGIMVDILNGYFQPRPQLEPFRFIED